MFPHGEFEMRGTARGAHTAVTSEVLGLRPSVLPTRSSPSDLGGPPNPMFVDPLDVNHPVGPIG